MKRRTMAAATSSGLGAGFWQQVLRDGLLTIGTAATAWGVNRLMERISEKRRQNYLASLTPDQRKRVKQYVDIRQEFAAQVETQKKRVAYDVARGIPEQQAMNRARRRLAKMQRTYRNKLRRVAYAERRYRVSLAGTSGTGAGSAG